MEDVFSVAYQQTDDEMDLEYAFFGIFDGHGGKEAAVFAKVNILLLCFILIHQFMHISGAPNGQHCEAPKLLV